MVFKTYNASNHPLSSTDIGGFILAIVELRCLDVGHGPSTFSRVRPSNFFFFGGLFLCFTELLLMTTEQTYWMEALSLCPLSAQNLTDEEFIQKVVENL